MEKITLFSLPIIFCSNVCIFCVAGEFPEVQTNPGVTHQFKVGDKVRVDLEMEILKIMQEGHGGWNPRMAEVRIK